ncbi:MAG: TolC family protein [bacterium]|nr:TolC family protein [bacterium]
MWLAFVAWSVSITSQADCQEPRVLTLEEGIQMALEKNEVLRMAREDLVKSREQVREAVADALPQLDLSVDYNRNWKLPSTVFDTPTGRQSVTIGSKNNIDGVLSLRQPLFASGKIGAGLKVAKLFAEYSNEQVRAVNQRVRASVEGAFYNVLLARDLVRVSKLALKRAQANLRQVRRLHEAGRVSNYEVLRAEVQVSSLRPDSIQAENGLVVARLNFKDAIGLDSEQSVDVRGGFRDRTDLEVAQVENLIQTGLASRPETRQMDRQVRMREQNVRIQQASSRPSVDLVASGRLQAQNNELDFKKDDFRQSWATGISIQIPLFDGFRTRAQVSQARADFRRAELEAQELGREVRLEIRQAWLDLRVTLEKLDAEALVVSQAQQGLAIAESRYANGVGTQLEVLDAQLVLQQMEFQYVRGQHNRAMALVNLEMAVGVLGEGDEK